MPAAEKFGKLKHSKHEAHSNQGRISDPSSGGSGVPNAPASWLGLAQPAGKGPQGPQLSGDRQGLMNHFSH